MTEQDSHPVGFRKPPRCGGRRDWDLDGGHEPVDMEPREDASRAVEVYQCPDCGAVVRP